MSHDLEGIGKAAAQYAGIKQGQNRRADGGRVRPLKNEHQNNGYGTGHKKLDAGHPDGVSSADEFFDRENVYGKAHRAEEGKQVALVDAGKTVRADAKAVKSRDPQQNADPRGPLYAFADHQSEDGHKDHIKGRDKSDLAAGGVGEGRLLQIARHAEDHAENGAGEQDFFVFQLFLPDLTGRKLFVLHGVADQDIGEQHRRAHERADAVKGKGGHVFHADALRGEGRTPDERREQ